MPYTSQFGFHNVLNCLQVSLWTFFNKILRTGYYQLTETFPPLWGRIWTNLKFLRAKFKYCPAMKKDLWFLKTFGSLPTYRFPSKVSFPHTTSSPQIASNMLKGASRTHNCGLPHLCWWDTTGSSRDYSEQDLAFANAEWSGMHFQFPPQNTVCLSLHKSP